MKTIKVILEILALALGLLLTVGVPVAIIWTKLHFIVKFW